MVRVSYVIRIGCEVLSRATMSNNKVLLSYALGDGVDTVEPQAAQIT